MLKPASKMVPKIHIIASIPFFLLFFILYGYWSFAFLLGAIFIDVDHLFWYFYRHKSLNLKKAYYYHRPGGGNEKDMLHIFHTIEFFVFLMILSFFYKLLWMVLLGVTMHLIMDIYDMYKYKYSDARALSVIRWLNRRLIVQ